MRAKAAFSKEDEFRDMPIPAALRTMVVRRPAS